jgi:DNA-binding LacI/PurR family transcriptional regulator
LKVPEELSVVGFDDISMASWPPYSVTTVRQPVKAMIDSTVHLMQRLARRSTEKPKVIRLPGELIVRGTTRRRSPK